MLAKRESKTRPTQGIVTVRTTGAKPTGPWSSPSSAPCWCLAADMEWTTMTDPMIERLCGAVSADTMMAHLQEFARHVKLSGTPEERESFRYLQSCLDAYGFRTELLEHDAYISLPGRARLEIGARLAGLHHPFLLASLAARRRARPAGLCRRRQRRRISRQSMCAAGSCCSRRSPTRRRACARSRGGRDRADPHQPAPASA